MVQASSMVDHGDMIHSKCPLHDIAHEKTALVLLRRWSLQGTQPVSFGNYLLTVSLSKTIVVLPRYRQKHVVCYILRATFARYLSLMIVDLHQLRHLMNWHQDSLHTCTCIWRYPPPTWSHSGILTMSAI